MSTFDLEYVNTVFQQGINTYSAKAHRRLGDPPGNPTLTIRHLPTHVEWTVGPLTQGAPDTNTGQPLKPRVDLYFLLSESCAVAGAWPASAGVAAATWGAARDPRGTERPGGKTILMKGPIGSLRGISAVSVQADAHTPAFTAQASGLTVYADIEHTPASDVYPTMQYQFHLGFQGDYVFKLSALAAGGSSSVVIKMSHANYEAIREKLNMLCDAI
jgi:hypothetical protein